jgi:hypothetical protein
MRASDLLGAKVVAANHRELGFVSGLRCSLDGPSDGPVPAPRLESLVVTPRLTGSSLGYQQHSHRGPWLIGAMIRWTHRGTRVVEWALVDEVVPHEEIRLKPMGDA